MKGMIGQVGVLHALYDYDTHKAAVKDLILLAWNDQLVKMKPATQNLWGTAGAP